MIGWVEEGELLRHCRGCRFFGSRDDGMSVVYTCGLIGDGGVLAVARYSIRGNVCDFEWDGFYPDRCLREDENDRDL